MKILIKIIKILFSPIILLHQLMVGDHETKKQGIKYIPEKKL